MSSYFSRAASFADSSILLAKSKGRIAAVQLSYSASHTHLQTAIRRAPSPRLAPGFLQLAYKFFVVVELLMGDIPERGIFRMVDGSVGKGLVDGGYFAIVQGEHVSSRSIKSFQLRTSSVSSRSNWKSRSFPIRFV